MGQGKGAGGGAGGVTSDCSVTNVTKRLQLQFA